MRELIGDVSKSWLLFRHPREFKIKSLYNNGLILNIANKLKETVQKLKFLDSHDPNSLFVWKVVYLPFLGNALHRDMSIISPQASIIKKYTLL